MSKFLDNPFIWFLDCYLDCYLVGFLCGVWGCSAWDVLVHIRKSEAAKKAANQS